MVRQVNCQIKNGAKFLSNHAHGPDHKRDVTLSP